MNLDALGNIGDFVGGFAVVLTLIYLAVQIRQNTRQVEQSMDLARAEATRARGATGFLQNIVQDGELADIYLKGMANPADLDAPSRIRFIMLIAIFFYEVELNYLAHLDGLLTHDRWEAQRGVLSTQLGAAGARYYWERFSQAYTPAFQKLISRELQAAA